MRFRLFALLTVALAGLLVVAGCSKDSKGTSVQDDGTLNYEDEFGGYTTSDELPGFGDEVILSEMSSDAETFVETEPPLDHVFDSLDAREDVDVYCMKILWGQLEYDSTAQLIVDWTGSLEAEYGAIRVGSLIRFEPGDHLVRPRSDASKLEWVSYTQPHFDGIMVFLYDTPDERAGAENTVTFTTPLYSRTFNIDELADLSEIVDVDDAGNKVSFESNYLAPTTQKNGFLEGRWVKNAMQRGVFFGRWMAYDGRSKGHLKGHFGVNRDGDQVFFGKWITNGGSFRGLLRGTWQADDPAATADPVSGTFDGIWADRSLTVQGKLGGEWKTKPFRRNNSGNEDPPGNNDEIGRIPKAKHGFFHGRYAETGPEI